MNPLRHDFSRLCRLVAEHLGIASTAMPALLIIICLAVLAMFSNISCGPQPTPPSVTPRITPTSTPVMPVIPTLEPTLHPPVTLIEPENGAEFNWGSKITLSWSCPNDLSPEEYYRLMVQPKGQDSFLFYHNEDHFALPDLLPGEYEWAVAVVRFTDQDQYEQVSKETQFHSFHIAPPPVVLSISPVSTAQGHSVQVVVSGENLIPSLTVIIGVPLQTKFVDDRTITATIPVTLAAGQYPVILQDPTGQNILSSSSLVSFTVKMPLPTPGVTRTPRTSYPPVELLGIDIIGCNVTLKWNWPRTLAVDEWFDVRIGLLPDEPHSVTWTKDQRYIFSLTETGEYVWEVATCRGDPGASHCSPLDGSEMVISERQVFQFGGCLKPKPTPAPF